jgi:spermidine synthase
LDSPQLFYYLLNPNFELIEADYANKPVDFLDIQESSNGLLAPRDLLKIESVAQIWLEQIYQSSSSPDSLLDATKLLPVQHRYHSPKMTREWLVYLKQLLAEIDLTRLLNSLLERSQELPPKVARELQQLAENLRTGKPLANLPPKTAEFVMMLSVTLLMANLVAPDTVFAKGSYSRGGTSSSSGGSTYVDVDSDYVTDDTWLTPFWGLIFTGIGVTWLINIFKRSMDE